MSYAPDLVPTLRVGMRPGRSASSENGRGTFPRGAWERETTGGCPYFAAVDIKQLLSPPPDSDDGSGDGFVSSLIFA